MSSRAMSRKSSGADKKLETTVPGSPLGEKKKNGPASATAIDVAVDREATEDFGDDEQLMKHVNPSRYIKLDFKGFRILRLNWLVTLVASLILWCLVIYCIQNDKEAVKDFKMWKSWVAQNFTWLYIANQNVWIGFLIWIGFFSKYGNLKLGKDDEKPKYDDLSWFAMLFSCGIGIGLYYYGVSEPMYYYNGYQNLKKPGFDNQDERAKQALFVTFFHWGFHGWAPYIVVALALGIVCFRQGHPLSLRFCFKPLVGEKVVKGVVGDFVDALSIACTTFGVCTSLGLGVTNILTGMQRLDIMGADPANEDHGVAVVVVITLIATLSVLSGIDRGIKYLSAITFACGNLLLLMVIYFDNTWFLLNTTVQSVGYYFQHIMQVGFDTDAFQQLNYEIDPSKTNLLMGSDGSKDAVLFRLHDKGLAINTSPTAAYQQSATEFMDWWTIFYWGWWISWAPFVGLFVAKISRGRTIRTVVVGAFLVPLLFVFLWFSVFGGLGVKMQRIAELALTPAGQVGRPTCAQMGYVKGLPTTDAGKELFDLGYMPLSCRPSSGQIFDILEPYTGFTKFMQYLALVGVILYFVTSSDSGSYVDDLISANGHANPPPIQKVYWCITEGATAAALIKAGGANSIAALQAISIVSGLPYTIFICLMCTSIYRAVKADMGEKDILEAAKWGTDVFDIFSWFDEETALGKMARLKSLGVAVLMPFVGLGKVMNAINPPSALSKMFSLVASIVLSGLWYGAVLLAIVGYSLTATEKGITYNYLNVANFGWVLFTCFAIMVAALRTQLRMKKGIYGSMLEDLFTTLTMMPFVISQLAYEADSESSSEEATM